MIGKNQSGEKIVAFIDIGTNSIRLLMVRHSPNHSFKVLTQQKEAVRLGEGEFVDEVLQPDAMQRSILVCRKFNELAQSYGAEEIIAVATSATRDARNQEDFLERLQNEAGLHVQVVSGREEARLIYLGVSSGLHIEDKKALFIDIGGGSTEIILGDQHSYDYLDSLKLGAIRLTMYFIANESGPISSSQYAQLQQHVYHSSFRTIQRLKDTRIDLAVGSSGTIQNLAEIAARYTLQRKRNPDDVLTYTQLQQVIRILCSLPLEERRKVPGINPERADIIIGGAAIIETLMKHLNISEIQVSERGLRDGLLIDYLSRTESKEASQLSVREGSVIQLGRACGFDEAHARHIANLALELFDSARQEGLHNLGASERELLGYAAMLHDVGAFLSYQNHQAHTYYVIRNADLLGFNQNEINFLAATAFFHRKTIPRQKHPEFAVLGKEDQQKVLILCVLLRIAESLDRSHSGIVRHVKLVSDGTKKLKLIFVADNDCQLEIWGLKNHEKAVAEVFKRKLLVEVGDRTN